jgi:hypothetical protein
MVFVDNVHHVSAFASQAPYTITEYYAVACPHCKTMAPVWDTAKADAAESQTLANNVEWVEKECYGKSWAPGKDLDFCTKKGVDAFPTLILEKNGTDQHWNVPGLTGNTVAQKAEQLLKFIETKTGAEVKMNSLGTPAFLASCALGKYDYRSFI